jgi:hypothetical protein
MHFCSGKLMHLYSGVDMCDRFKYDINAYLAHLGPLAPKNLDDIIASQKFHPSILKYLLDSQAEAPPDQNPQCQTAAVNRLRSLRASLRRWMTLGSTRWSIQPRTTRRD